jgi:hypothetical protein
MKKKKRTLRKILASSEVTYAMEDHNGLSAKIRGWKRLSNEPMHTAMPVQMLSSSTLNNTPPLKLSGFANIGTILFPLWSSQQTIQTHP